VHPPTGVVPTAHVTAVTAACRDACRADGVACVDAQDCCTLACNSGKCGGTICKVESETCVVNADCLGGFCDIPGPR
jgi:hypothetical protein